MATIFSSTAIWISVSYSSSFKTRNLKNLASLQSQSHFLYNNPLSISRPITRYFGGCEAQKFQTQLSSVNCLLKMESLYLLLFLRKIFLSLVSDRTSLYMSRNSIESKQLFCKMTEETVVVEESFQPNSFPNDTDIGSSGKPLESSLENWVIKIEQSVNIFLTDSVIKILDAFYHDRDYARFFVLETIARVPYFAFMSVLHMYESFGWWRRADYLKVHFAESWNEMHHLLIMEESSLTFVTILIFAAPRHLDSIKATHKSLRLELGGNAWWFDRFLAQHIAIFYYIMTVLMYALSPRMALILQYSSGWLFQFSLEILRTRILAKGIHALETYDKFLKAQGEDLKKMPAPEVAVNYYTGGDLYLFDEFQTSRVPNTRRPKIENLYNVFLNIREDEAEHCKTMKACQTHGNLRSPSFIFRGCL
ncbi:Ubiquinol oxidase [Quillaja saponaria]|uniref:Ubiquinol oxidase n=1 Tax=Quillaja saponaria TaxID=32244 RepID=A0AAD7PUI7_QUISA|nr:Ubiquinol oxidase [Quillaja saponaria]